ncbi:MAG: hypothetical protein ACU0DK_13820 [Pseudooceanicola sp.]
MTFAPSRAHHTTRRSILAFAGLALLLYASVAFVAEFTVGRGEGDAPFRRLLSARGVPVDVAVLGASHALPLRFGGVPERLEAETGQSMLVLAEVGAGPLYALFVARQALRDLPPRRVVYVLDDFAFFSDDWNEERVADRGLLRQTPWRFSTARILTGLVLREGVPAGGLADYLTGFSKVNPPDRFPQAGWVGEAGFDRGFRPSRHAISSRAAYLYPDGTSDGVAGRYLDALEEMLRDLRAEGVEVSILRLPVSEPFRTALPDVAGFEHALAERLHRLEVPVHDLRGTVGDPALFFDTDHLNREGIDTLYASHLRDILSGGASALSD